MKAQEHTDRYAELVDEVANLSKKDYIDLWRITRKYRKAHRAFDNATDRQKRESLPTKSKSKSDKFDGLKFEKVKA